VIAVSCSDLTAGEYIVLDLATQAIGCGTSAACAAMVAAYPQNLDYILTLAATTDGSKILFFNGIVFGLWDVTSDTFTSQPASDQTLGFAVVQTAAAADGTAYAQFSTVALAVLDPTLYESVFVQDVDYLQTATRDINAAPGMKLHPSGGLLYFPRYSGFDIFDAHHGHIQRRVDFSLSVPFTFDAMALDETGSRVFLISAAGLAIVDIADLPLVCPCVCAAVDSRAEPRLASAMPPQ
jgi:hypothetical protein